MSGYYFVKPRATLDVENQASYCAVHFGMEATHRFIQAANETYELLAQHPQLGWTPRFGLRSMKALRVFRVNGFAPMLSWNAGRSEVSSQVGDAAPEAQKFH